MCWLGLDFTVASDFRVAVLTVNDVSGGWCLTVSVHCTVMAFTVQGIMREVGGQDAMGSKVPIGKQYGSTVR